MSTKRLLTIIIALQCVILLGQFNAGNPILPAANAQIPNAGDQRLQQLEELQAMRRQVELLTTKVTATHELLSKGELQVRVVSTDQK